MSESSAPWLPGSFTKNFSWGDSASGLRRLHEAIRLGFNNEMKDVERGLFRERLKGYGAPDYIPINFFLFNSISDGTDYLVADELVFQAISSSHTEKFDRLALFAFNFSYCGRWISAAVTQRRPALWAFHYIRDRVASEFDWQTSRVSADDIAQYVGEDPRYQAKTVRKLSTNLSYLYMIGGLADFASPRVSAWWVDTLFLALDRLILDRQLDGKTTRRDQSRQIIDNAYYQSLSGKWSLEKSLALDHLIELYWQCGSRQRFNPDFVVQTTRNVLTKEGTAESINEFDLLHPNDDRPQGAIHPTNARILKSIPRVCALLAKYTGFDVIDADEMENFDVNEYIERKTREAFEKIKLKKISPAMTVEELMRITRDR